RGDQGVATADDVLDDGRLVAAEAVVPEDAPQNLLCRTDSGPGFFSSHPRYRSKCGLPKGSAVTAGARTPSDEGAATL
ncbi:hypothetical protein, partial [Nocardia farcinica]|uniref:hypothetical protein n=1 Tax=Nocardia farcinica TaxID=37329 RepID=UPI0024554D03